MSQQWNSRKRYGSSELNIKDPKLVHSQNVIRTSIRKQIIKYVK